jgi:hypothetical protein
VSGVSVDQQVTGDQPHTRVGVGERSVEVRTEQTLLTVAGDRADVVVPSMGSS